MILFWLMLFSALSTAHAASCLRVLTPDPDIGGRAEVRFANGRQTSMHFLGPVLDAQGKIQTLMVDTTTDDLSEGHGFLRYGSKELLMSESARKTLASRPPMAIELPLPHLNRKPVGSEAWALFNCLRTLSYRGVHNPLTIAASSKFGGTLVSEIDRMIYEPVVTSEVKMLDIIDDYLRRPGFHYRRLKNWRDLLESAQNDHVIFLSYLDAEEHMRGAQVLAVIDAATKDPRLVLQVVNYPGVVLELVHLRDLRARELDGPHGLLFANP